MEIIKKLNEDKDKVGKPAKGIFQNGRSNFNKEIKLNWKTLKEQLSIDMLRFGKFLRRLLITDKK